MRDWALLDRGAWRQKRAPQVPFRLVVSNIVYLSAHAQEPFQRGALFLTNFGRLVPWIGLAMASLWGDPGQKVVWGFDHSTAIGASANVVAEIVSVSEGSVLARLWPCGRNARFLGDFDIPNQCQAITVFQGKLICKSPMPVFEVGGMDSVLCHRRCTRDDMWNMIELCAGIGVGTMGFNQAGIRTVCAADWSRPFTQAFQEIHPDIPVVTGDIGDSEVLKQLYRLHPEPAMLMCGFACQPFSAGGQQRGANDDRSLTLPKTLRAAVLLRSVAVILECVQDAGSNSMVRNLVDSFAQECGYHLAEVNLQLSDVWVSKRARWWAILTAPFIGQVSLRGFLASEHPAVPRDLFPSPLVVSPAELEQLLLHPEELEKFRTYEPNLGRLFLKLDGKAPTALHSWGSQVLACHCGCRSAGFSHDTLSKRGLYGILIPLPALDSSSDSSMPMLRHPHPTAVALLNGVPEIVWPDDLRLVLAGLGQMAAPFHALWIGAQLQQHLDTVFFGSSNIDLLGLMDQLAGRMSQIADSLTFLPASPMDLPEPPVEDLALPFDDVANTPWAQFKHLGSGVEVTVVHESDQVPYTVKLSTCEDTVESVIEASCELLGFSLDSVRVLDCGSGLDLPLHHPAAGLCLWICPKTQHADPDQLFGALDVSPTIQWVPDCTATETDERPNNAEASPGFVNAPVLDPVANLDAERLPLVTEPSIPDLALMQALRNQTMTAEARREILGNQGTIWADDEMLFHMQQMQAAANKATWAVMDPLLCAEAIKRPSSGLIGQWIRSLGFRPTAILGVVCCNRHWTPFIWTWTAHCTIASSWDVPGSPPPGFSVLHQAIATAVGSRTFTAHIVHRNFAGDTLCGICALRFIDSMLRGKMLPTSAEEAHQLHVIGRSLFVAHLESLASVPRPWIFGAGLDPKAADRLHALLSDHGVDTSQVKARGNLLIQAIGLAATQQAVTSGQPWRALKAAANQCRPPFQIVLPAELEAVVGRKAQQGGIKGKKKGSQSTKKSQTKPEQPPGLDPAKLLIEDGVFALHDGTQVNQISLSDIGPFATGVILCTVEQASAYLRASQLVSTGGLGLVLLNGDPSHVGTSLSWSTQRVILRCQANKEPILAPACLVQLGHQAVISKPAQDVSEALHAPAACLKVAIYRDSVEDWDQVIRAPVKYLLGLLPPLQVCVAGTPTQPCQCPKWHASPDSCVEDPVLDVWRRQWVSLSFQACSAERAEAFLVNLRCLESQLEAALNLSGRNGLFLEPRSLDARESHLDYQVLWLPKVDLAELTRLQQCTAGALGLARIGSRLGIRSRLRDAPSVAQTLKPGSVFLAAGSRSSFELGPLPFGCDRLTVSKLCAQWGWKARPLQPSRTVDGTLGNMWRVQACTDPPNNVVYYQGNEIVITKISEGDQQSANTSTQVIGNSATVQLCSKEATPGTDPWLKNDPWAPAQPHSAPAPTVDAQTSIKEVEARITQKVWDKFNAGNMEVDTTATEARFAALEQQVQSLTAHQQQMEIAIEDSSKRSDNQIAALQAQVTTQIDNQGVHIQGMFQAQLQQIEALLSKRARME